MSIPTYTVSSRYLTARELIGMREWMARHAPDAKSAWNTNRGDVRSVEYVFYTKKCARQFLIQFG